MKNRKLRILWNSNSLFTMSGYGQQSAEILPKIRDAGFPVAASDFFGIQGGKIEVDGIVHYPVINHVYGSDALLLHGQDFKADVSFSFQDSWVLNPQDLSQVNRYIPVCPIDHDPVTGVVLQNLKFAYRIVTYSKFGQQQLLNHGFHSTYIPHTVDTTIFKPMDKKERKMAGGINPDTFLVGMVAANKDNPPRKSFQEVMDAFVMFLRTEPNAMLYIHSNPDFPGGFNFRQYANFIGIGDKVLNPDSYQMNFNIGKEQMALIYNSFDVLLMPSISEGFGIPAIEAQACGIPVIVNNFTSMPELVVEGRTGEICEVAYKRFSPQGSYMGIPSVPSIHDKLVKIYRADRVKMGTDARKWIVDNYDTKTVFDNNWLPYLELLESEIYPVDKTK